MAKSIKANTTKCPMVSFIPVKRIADLPLDCTTTGNYLKPHKIKLESLGTYNAVQRI